MNVETLGQVNTCMYMYMYMYMYLALKNVHMNAYIKLTSVIEHTIAAYA